MLYLKPFTSFKFDGKIYDVYFEHERNDKKFNVCELHGKSIVAINNGYVLKEKWNDKILPLYRAITRCEIWTRGKHQLILNYKSTEEIKNADNSTCVGTGIARCTWMDNFNSRLGRAISFGRAIGSIDTILLTKKDRKSILNSLKKRKEYVL